MWRASKNGHQILRRRVGDDWQVARSARRHSALGAVLTRVLGCGRDILSGVACRNVFPSFLCARVCASYLCYIVPCALRSLRRPMIIEPAL